MKKIFAYVSLLAVLLAAAAMAFEAQPATQERATLQPGDTFSDTLTSGEAGPEMVVVPAGWACGDESRFSAPVGQFPSNAWGLHDMQGNGWEWVQDCWNDSYEGAPSDGSAWLEGDCSRHVIRGGSWRDGPQEMRSAFRFGLAERSGFPGENFRVARELAP